MSILEHMKDYFWYRSKYAKIKLGIIISAGIGLIVNNCIQNIDHSKVLDVSIFLWFLYIAVTILERDSKHDKPKLESEKQ